MEFIRHRHGGGLVPTRAQARVSAFVYGNITTLGALAAVSLDAVQHGTAAVTVGVTAIATFVAHVVAHAVSTRIGTEVEGSESALHASELRDAVPIASSGGLPAVLLLLGALAAVPAMAAWLCAVGVVMLRLLSTGLVIERLSGRPASKTAFWAGVLLAAISAAIAVGKALLSH